MKDLKELIESKIAEKAGSDPGFGKTLLENPRRAIEATLGIAIPPDVEVAVREENANKICVILTEGSQGTEIADELLEQVAGGCTGGSPWG
jgi:hypothetical protein